MNCLTRAALSATFLFSAALHGAGIDFEDKTLGSNTFENGAGLGGAGFTSGIGSFNNLYDSNFGSWGGWGYSNRTDTADRGANNYTNDGAAITGIGAGGSANYGVGYYDSFNGVFPTIVIPDGNVFISLDITNTAYAYYSMLNGDIFTLDSEFGGPTGTRPDRFWWTVEGFDSSGISTGTLEIDLADYRFSNSSDDYILDTWKTVDLTSLGNVVKLVFTPDGTVFNDFGLATPTYLAVDNIQTAVVPEIGSMQLLSLVGMALLLGHRMRESRRSPCRSVAWAMPTVRDRLGR